MKATDLLERYKLAQRSVTILLDGSLPAQISDLKRRIKVAKLTEREDGLASQTVQLEKELADLESVADEASVTITMTALPGDDFSKLVAEHPVEEDDWEAFRAVQQHNPLAAPPEYHQESFAPALIGLSVSHVDGDPVEWDTDDGIALWAGLSDGARADLWETALTVNLGRSQRPLSKTAIGETDSSGSGSTTAPNEESVTPSS